MAAMPSYVAKSGYQPRTPRVLTPCPHSFLAWHSVQLHPDLLDDGHALAQSDALLLQLLNGKGQEVEVGLDDG